MEKRDISVSVALNGAHGVRNNRLTRRPLRLLASSAFAALGMAQIAHAEQSTQVGEVVVTAEKRSEVLKNVPASVAVLGGEALRTQAANSLEDYVARVPGLVLNSQSPGQQMITIRGVSTGPNGAPTVATYIDDSPVGVSTGDGGGGLLTPDIDSIDLQRIEVLRGPQGTLYGASNIGGLLKYVTIAPSISKFGGEVGVEGQSADHGGSGYAVRGRVNVPIADQAAVLVSGYHREDPGFISDDGRGLKNVDGTNVSGGRVSLLWNPLAALSIKGEILGQDRIQNGFSEVDLNPATLAPLYGQYQQRRATGSDFAKINTRLYSLTASYDLGWADVTETTSYNTVNYKGSQDQTGALGAAFGGGNPDFGVRAGFLISENKISQEIRLSGQFASVVDWLVGAYYTHENTNTGVTFPTFNSVTGASIAFPSLLEASTITHYDEYAAFGELTYHVTSRLDLIGGFRYASDKERGLAIATGQFVGPLGSTTPSSSSDTSPTFSVSPRFKLTKDLTVYARVASGYRPGGANGGYAPKPTFAPDKVLNYEAGLKGDFPTERASFEISAFHVDWSNIQLQLLNPQNLVYEGNAGDAVSQGVEAAGSYSPLEGLTLSASADYTDAHISKAPPMSTLFITSGAQLPFNPRFKSSVSADYDFAIVKNWGGFVGATYLYTDDETGQFTGSATRVKLPSYGTFDARIGAKTDRLTLELFIKNATDQVGYNGYTAMTGSSTAFSIIQPRVVGVQLTSTF